METHPRNIWYFAFKVVGTWSTLTCFQFSINLSSIWYILLQKLQKKQDEAINIKTDNGTLSSISIGHHQYST